MNPELVLALKNVAWILDVEEGKKVLRAYVAGYEFVIVPLAPGIKDKVEVKAAGNR